MKLLPLLGTSVLATVASAQTLINGAGIEFSRHNFATATWNTPRPGELCAVCHIPHVEARAATRTQQTLLWGREMSTAQYTPYTSPTMNATMGQPTGSSRLCLGCHDGSVALDMFNSNTTPGTVFVTGATLVPGKPNFDFGADHPVSIPYLATDTGLRDKNSTPFGPTGTRFIKDYLEASPQGDLVQCATCHDVHNRDVAPGPASNPMNYQLRMAINVVGRESEICLACHIK